MIIKNLKEIKLIFDEENWIYNNIFWNYVSKKIIDTLKSKRYNNLNIDIAKYDSLLNKKTWEFLLMLKDNHDSTYLKFLNKYGDLEYSIFFILPNDYNLKWIYFYYINDTLKYIWRCKDSMRKRINQWYGKIYPKNCFKDGQSTNCHINSLITLHKSKWDIIKLMILPIEDNIEIEEKEIELIKKYIPEWNTKI